MANFNSREHLITIKNRQGAAEYLPVQWRLVWFRQECPQGTIETEMVHLDLEKETEEETFVWNAEKRRSEKVIKTAKGIAIFRATVKDGKGGTATSTKMEKAASFPDYLEKSETGAIGRALAALGYGTQFTADDLNEAHRIVDSPVERAPIPPYANGTASSVRPAPAATNGHSQPNTGLPATHAPVATPDSETSATEEQLNSIRKLCDRLSKPAPENITELSYLAARKVIRELTGEYRELKQQSNKAS
jgi:hypothetical protein